MCASVRKNKSSCEMLTVIIFLLNIAVAPFLPHILCCSSKAITINVTMHSMYFHLMHTYDDVNFHLTRKTRGFPKIMITGNIVAEKDHTYIVAHMVIFKILPM